MMCFKSKIDNNRGQTAVEYILVVAVAVALIYGVMGRVKSYFYDDPDSFLNKMTKKEFYFEGDYRVFTIRR